MGDNTYSQGEQLELNCLSEGGPELEYTWTFSGGMIDNANTSMLTIANVTTSDGGEYTCSVSNDAGSNMETITVYSKFFVCTVYRMAPNSCSIKFSLKELIFSKSRTKFKLYNSFFKFIISTM